MSNSEKFDNALAQYLSGNVPKTSLQVAEQLLHNADAQQRQYANVENARQTKRSLNIHARPYTPTSERTWGEAFSDTFHKGVGGIGQTATNLIQLGIGATEFGLAVATGNGDEVANKLSKGIDNVTGFANSMSGGIIPKSDLNAPFRETDYENTGRSQFMQDVSNNAKMFSEMLSINAQERSNEHSEAMSDTYKRKAQEFEQAYESQKTDSALGNIFTRLKLAMEYDEVAGGMVAGSASSVALGGMLAKLGGADKALKTMAVLEGTSGYQQVKQEAIEAGIDFDNLQDPRAREAQQKAFNAGALSAGITFTGSTLAKRMGATDLDIGNTVAGTVSQSAKAGIVDSVLRSALGVGTDLAEEAGIAIANRTQANLATGKDTFENVDKDVTDSLIATGGLKVATSGLPTAVNMVSGTVKGISDGLNAVKPATQKEMMDITSNKYNPVKAFNNLTTEFLNTDDATLKAEYAKQMYAVAQEARTHFDNLNNQRDVAEQAGDVEKVKALEAEIGIFNKRYYDDLVNRIQVLNEDGTGTWESVKQYAGRSTPPVSDNLGEVLANVDMTDVVQNGVAPVPVQPTAVQSNTDLNSQTAQEQSPTSTNAVIKMGKYQFSNNKQTNSDDVGRGSGDHLDIHLTGNLKGGNPTEYLDRFIVADGSHQGKDLKTLLSSGAYKPSNKQVFGASRKANGKSYSHDGIDFDSRIGGGVIINPKYQIKDVTAHHNPNGYGHYVKVHFADGVSIGLGHMGKANVDAFMQAYKPNGTKATGSTTHNTSNGEYQFNSSLKVNGFTAEKAEAIRQSAKRLGVNPNDLASLISFETAGTFNPSIKNMQGGSATGLIQFMPATARELGTSTEALAKMSFAEQMVYVEKYFRSRGLKGGEGVGELYDMVTGVQSKEYRAGSKEYDANKIWDVDNNGIITKGEAVTGKKFKDHVREYFVGGAINTPVNTSDVIETKDDTLLKPTITLDDVKSESGDNSENITPASPEQLTDELVKTTENTSNETSKPTINRVYSKMFEGAEDASTVKERAELARQAGEISNEQAQLISKLSDVKELVRAKTSNEADRHIYEGLKGSNNQSSNLGLKDYFNIFTKALDGHYNPSLLRNRQEQLESFNDYTSRKLQAFNTAYNNLQQGKPSTVYLDNNGDFQVMEGIRGRRSQGEQSWTFNYDLDGKGGTNQATKFLNTVSGQANAIQQFTEAWREPIGNILSSPAKSVSERKAYDIADYLPKNQVKSQEPSSATKPVQNNSVQTKPNQETQSIQDNQVVQAVGAENIPETSSVLGKHRNSKGMVSMSNLTHPTNKIKVGEQGWLGNPYSLTATNSFGASNVQEAMDKYVHNMKKMGGSIKGFVEGLVNEKSKEKVRKDVNEVDTATANFLEKLLDKLPNDTKEAQEFLNNIQSYDVDKDNIVFTKPLSTAQDKPAEEPKQKKRVKKVAEEVNPDLADINEFVENSNKNNSEKSDKEPAKSTEDLSDIDEFVQANKTKEVTKQDKPKSITDDTFAEMDKFAEDFVKNSTEEATQKSNQQEVIEEQISQADDVALEPVQKLNPKRVVMPTLKLGNTISVDDLVKIKKGTLLGHTLTKPSDTKSLRDESRNLFTESFRSNGKSNLAKYENMTDQLIDTGLSMLTALGIKAPSEKQKEQLSYFLGFKELIGDALVDSYTSVNKGYEYKDLKQYIIETDTDGSVIIDDNLVTAISLAVYDYAVMNGSVGYQTNKDILRIVGIDENPASSLLHSELLDPFRQAVGSQQIVALDLGKQITRSLGISSMDTADVKALSRLQSSLGNWAVASMLNTGMFEQEMIPASAIQNILNELNSLAGKNKVVEIELDNKIEYPYLKANIIFEKDDNGKDVPIIQSDLVSEAIQSNKGTGQFLSDVFGFESHKKYPTLQVTEKDKQKTKVDKLGIEISDIQKDNIDVANNAPFKFNKGFVNVLQAFKDTSADAGKEWDKLLSMIGGIVTEADLAKQHNYFHDGMKGTAEGIKREIENAFEFIDTLPDLETEFYDTADVKSNLRQHYRSNVFNPQSNKQHRAMAELSNFSQEMSVDEVNDFLNGNYFDSEGNPTAMSNWFRGVFSGLEGFEKSWFEKRLPQYADGWTEDKIPSEDFIPVALDLVRNNHVQQAIKELQKIIDGDFANADKELIAKFVQKGEGNLQSFRSLYELATLFKAVDEGVSFKTSLGYASDGWNNGVAIASQQQGIKDEMLWKRIGLFKQGEGEKSYTEVRRNKSIGDFYIGLGEFIKRARVNVAREWENAPKSKFAKELVILSAFMDSSSYLYDRKNLKNVLIPFNYGARSASIIRASFSAYVENIYKTLPKKSVKEIKELEATLSKASGKVIKIEDPLTFELSKEEYKALQENFTKTVGKVIDTALTAYAPDLIQRRDVNQSIVSLATNLSMQGINQVVANKVFANVQKNFELNLANGLKDVSAITLANYNTLSVKEQNEIEKEFPLLLPSIGTVFTAKGSKGDGLPLVVRERTPSKELGDFTEQYTNINGKKTKMPSLIETNEYVDRGLAPTSAQTQSVDSYISSFANIFKGITGLNIHDANIGNVRHYIDMVKAQNMTFFEAIRDYHYFAESLKTLDTVLSGYEEYGLDNELVAIQLTSLIGIAEEDLIGLESEDLAELVITTIDRVKEWDLQKLANLEELEYIQQYLGEGGRIEVTDEMRASIEKARENLNHLYDVELDGLKARIKNAFKEPSKADLETKAENILQILHPEKGLKLRMGKQTYTSIQSAFQQEAEKRELMVSLELLDNEELLKEIVKEAVMQNSTLQAFNPLTVNQINSLNLDERSANLLYAFSETKKAITVNRINTKVAEYEIISSEERDKFDIDISKQGEYALLANESYRPFYASDGKLYASVAHAYESNKAGEFNPKIYNNAKWGEEIFSHVINFVSKEGLASNHLEMLEDFMRQSFEQNPAHLKLLLKTQNGKITDHRKGSNPMKVEVPRLLNKLKSEFSIRIEQGDALLNRVDDTDVRLMNPFEKQNANLSTDINRLQALIKDLKSKGAEQYAIADATEKLNKAIKSRESNWFLFNKDKEKASKANKFIGMQKPNVKFLTSTEFYRRSYGVKANSGNYNSEDVVFISVNGGKDELRLSIHNSQELKNEINKAIDAGVTFITDTYKYRTKSDYNIGEREVATYLTQNGYKEINGSGKWVKKEDNPKTPKNISDNKTTDRTSRKISLEAVKHTVNNLNVEKDSSFRMLFDNVFDVVKSDYPDLKFSFKDLPKNVKGYYENNEIVLNNVIWDNLNAYEKLGLINHEMMHAITVGNLYKYKGTQAVQNLLKMYQQLKGKYNKEPYLKDIFESANELEGVAELMAYGTENSLVIEFIAKNLDHRALDIKVKSSKYKGALGGFYEAIHSFLTKVIKKHTPYRAFLENVETVIALDNSVENTKNFSKSTSGLLHSRNEAIEIMQGMPIANINQKDIAVPKEGFKSVITWATELFESWDNKAVNPLLGEVILNEQSIRDSLGHRISFHKVLAIPAIKSVVEKGAVIHVDTSNPAEDSFFISAPILLDGKENIMTLTIHRDVNIQRMYVHSVSLTDKIKNTPLTAQVSVAPDNTGELHSLQSNQESNLPSGKSYGKSGRKSKKHTDATTPDEVEMILQDLLNSNIPRLYSKDYEYDEAVKKVNELDVKDLLKGLGTGSMSAEFNTHLDNVIDKLVDTYYGFTERNLVNKNKGNLKYLKQHGFMQSQKEAYTHNAVYEVLELFLKDNSGSLPANGLDKLLRQAQGNYSNVKALFKDFDNVDNDTQKRYTKMFNYVFKTKQGNSTARFVALALTNQEFANTLDSTQTKQTQSDKSWFDKAMSLFSTIMDYLLGRVMNVESSTDLAKIKAYTNALAKLETQVRNGEVDRFQRTYEGGMKLLNAPNSLIHKSVKNSVKWVAKSKLPVVSKIASAGYNFANGDSESVLRLYDKLDNANATETQKLMRELTSEVLHNGSKGVVVDKLVRITQQIGKVRQATKDSTIRSLASQFTKMPTQEQSKTITNGLLKTDMSSLLTNGLSIKDVSKMLSPETRVAKINELQSKLKEHIGSTDRYRHTLLQVKALGKYMTTEITTDLMDFNSEAIARSFGSDWQVDTINPDVLKIVDTLVTLYALNYVSNSEIATLKALFKSEEKGMVAMLNAHQALTQKSKREFQGNPLNFHKGYIPQITNPHMEVVASEIPDVAVYRERGFDMIGALDQDKDDNSPKRYLMVHTNHNTNNFVSGAMDMTDSHTKGSVIFEAGTNDKDILRIAKSKAQKRRNRVKHVNYDIDADAYAMVATYATDGSIMNYKYEMSADVRDRLLERNLDSFELLGTLAGSLSFRPLIREQQRNVAKVLIDDAKDYTKNPNAYVLLDFNSKDPKIVSMIRLLPYEAHKVLVDTFGMNKPIPVRASLYTTMFGYKGFSLINAFDKLDTGEKLNMAELAFVGLARAFLHSSARSVVFQVEQAVMGLMAQIKDMIVIRSGGVLLGNILSNMQLLMMQGINPLRVIKDVTFAWRNGRAYSKDSNRLYEIDALLTMTKNNKELGKLRQERKLILDRLERNPMHPYMEAGLQSTIVEDLTLDNNNGYKSSLEKRIDKITNQIPEDFRNMFNIATIAKGTQLHSLLSEATQFSDFVAKYSLTKYKYEQMLEQYPDANKQDLFDRAIYEGQENFINYDIPTHYLIDYANRMGFMMFTKFFLRFQLILAKLLKEKPAQMIGMHLLAEGLGTQGIIEPAWFNRFGNPFDESVFMGADAFSNIATVDAVF